MSDRSQRTSTDAQLGGRPGTCRALHVFGRLDRGGAETWLMDVVRRVDRNELAIDVCVIGNGTGTFDREFESLGGLVHRCPLSAGLLAFRRSFNDLLARKQYDVVHSHVYLFSGFLLKWACRTGVPRRVAHLHPVEDVKKHSPARRLYASWMHRRIDYYGTHFVGPTQASLESFWGERWRNDPRCSVLYNGVDARRFAASRSNAVRTSLQIPLGAKLVLNVARFAPHKRQTQLLSIAKNMLARRSDVYFVCIGAGPLREQVISEVAAAGLDAHFRFIEGADDIDAFWLTADAFAFPSVAEGFGIVVAEAGAAGLPVVAHDIPGIREASRSCHTVTLLPVDSSTEAWIDALTAVLKHGPLSDDARIAHLSTFPFTIETSIDSLRRLYGVK